MSITKTVLTDLHIDALREVATIGTGHAVTSLSTMVGEPFMMSVPAFGVVALTEFEEIIGDLEALAAAVYMPVLGDAPGHVAFLFPYKHACELADVLLGQPRGTTGSLEEMACSALMEVGNVLISSFVNAISDLTRLFLPVSPPGIAVDMTGAILQSLSTVSPDLGDHALTIMTRLADKTFPIEGVFIYIPEPTALPTLFHALGMDL
jgi:chemotaxis protein CheC